MNIQINAKEMYQAFQSDKRDNGETFYKLEADCPKWMTDLCRKAHDDMMPDDFKYEAIMSAVEHIAKADGDEDDMRDQISEWADSMVDIYNADLTRWVASHLERAWYVEEAQREFGPATDQDGRPNFYRSLSQGQYMEYEEVYNLALSFLEEMEGEE